MKKMKNMKMTKFNNLSETVLDINKINCFQKEVDEEEGYIIRPFEKDGSFYILEYATKEDRDKDYNMLCKEFNVRNLGDKEDKKPKILTFKDVEPSKPYMCKANNTIYYVVKSSNGKCIMASVEEQNRYKFKQVYEDTPQDIQIFNNMKFEVIE